MIDNKITVSRWISNFSRIWIKTKQNNESNYYGFMNKSVEPLVRVLVVTDLMCKPLQY